MTAEAAARRGPWNGAAVRGFLLSLRARILGLVLLMVLIPAAATVVYLLRARDADIREAERGLAAGVLIASGDLAARVNGTTQLLFGLAQSRALDTDDRAACSAHLAEVLRRYPQYTGILTIRPDGQLFCDSLQTGRKLDLNDRAYFRQAMASENPAYELVFGRLTGVGVMQVALASRDRSGAVKFVLLASINLAKFATESAREQHFPRTVLAIFDRAGTMIASDPGPGVASRAGQNFAGSELFRFAGMAKPGGTARLTGLRGLDRIWARGALPDDWNTGLSLVMGVPFSELTANADRRLHSALLVFGLASLVATFAALALAHARIRRPLQRVTRRIDKLRRGDLATRIGQPYPSDEIGEVMRALDDTVAELQSQQAVIARQADEQRQAQAELARSEAQFRAIFDNVGVGIVRIGLDGTFLQVNQRFCDMLGYSQSELVGRRNVDITHPDDVGLTQKYFDGLVRDGGAKLPLRKRCLRKDGAVLWMENAKTLVRDAAGRPDYVIGVMTDITMQRTAQAETEALQRELEERVERRTSELAEANRSLESFSYSVSHDLRTPLRAISGFSEILARRHRESLNDEGRRYLDNVVRAAGMMGRLIEDLLAYAGLGRKSVGLRPVPLDGIVEAVVRQLQQRVDELGAELYIPDDLPVVQGDSTLLTQVFLNLIDNALTYRKPGTSPVVTLTWRSDGDVVIVCVSDHGIGIPATQFEYIFGVFQRLHRQDEYPGTGIGLATVKRAVEMMGGTVSVASVVGEGSTFAIRLGAAGGAV